MGIISRIKNLFRQKPIEPTIKQEYAIGESFVFEGRELYVIEDDSDECYQCAFDDEIYGCMRPYRLNTACSSQKRSDKKNVIFKQRTSKYEIMLQDPNLNNKSYERYE